MHKFFIVIALFSIISSCSVEEIEVKPNVFEDSDFVFLTIDSVVNEPTTSLFYRDMKVYISIPFDKMSEEQRNRGFKILRTENGVEKTPLENDRKWFGVANEPIGKTINWSFYLGDEQEKLTKAIKYSHKVK